MSGIEMLMMHRYSMGDRNVVLIAVSGTDIASTNQADALMNLAEWNSLPDVEGHAAFRLLHCRIWILPGSILREDFLARRWYEATGETPTEVIFPSRHSAASGRPSLTLHPIGVMQLDEDEEPPYGGKAGDAPPPSPRLASWWKELLQVASSTDFGLEFDTSLEVTHHGPWLEVPSLFIEVGSTDATWGHVPAAECLAGIIHRGLGLDGSDGFGHWDAEANKGELVLITLGGGHYAPRANLLAQLDGVHLGHMLATYALPFIPPTVEGELPGGNWKQSLNAAFRSTQIAFPNGKIIFSMDKKAFKGWQRQAIREHLELLQTPLLTSKNIRALLETE
jgi:D-aminoacyl-tRNA deacylase